MGAQNRSAKVCTADTLASRRENVPPGMRTGIVLLAEHC